MVIPLWEKGVVTGTLKIYYCHAHRITSTLQEMAIGLSQIISTQLEVSRAEQLREMANKAELRALQSKLTRILFNALNAISSSIRLNPDTARQLIFNLSRYLRYNIELKTMSRLISNESCIRSKIISLLNRRDSATS